MTLVELVEQTSINRSAAHRLMQTLQSRNLVAREQGGRRYVVGGGMVALSAIVMQENPLREVARPVLESLVEETLETVSLHIRSGRHRICVDSIEGKHPIRRVVELGETLPLYAGTTAAAMLAFLPDAEREQIRAWAREEGTDMTALAAMLDQVRREGYVAGVGRRVPGVGGLSVPVFNSLGVVAALTVSGPGDRWTDEAMQAASGVVKQAGRRLSTTLGHVLEPEAGARS